MSIKKRGRPRKARVLQQTPSMENVLSQYNTFQEKLDKQLPRDTFKMHFYRRDQYDGARKKGIAHRSAIGAANKATAKKFNCSVKTVLNNIGTIQADGRYSGGALARNGKILERLQRETLFPRMEQYNQDVRSLTRAATLLRHPAYADLEPLATQKAGGNSCRYLLADPMYANLEPTLLDAHCLARFQLPESTRADSPQRVASVLAEAFTRAHKAASEASARAEKAERELGRLRTRAAADAIAPGYGRRKLS